MGNYYYNLFGGLNTEMTALKLGADSKKLYWADALNIEPFKSQGVTRQKGNKVLLDLANVTELKSSENSDITNEDGTNEADINGENASGDNFDNKGTSGQRAYPIGLCPIPKSGEDFVLGLSDGKIFRYNKESGILKPIYDFKVCPKEYIFEYFLDGLIVSPLEYDENAVDSIFYAYKKDTSLGGTISEITQEDNPNQTGENTSVGAQNTITALNFKDKDGNFIKPTAAAQFAGRLWLAAENILYYSALGTFNDWVTEHDAGYISNFHSSTAKITALKDYAGSLAIYKNYEVFLLTGSDPETFAIIKFADKGVSGEKCVLTCNNRQYFFNSDGLFCLSMAGELNQIVMGQNLASRIAKLFQKLDMERFSSTILCSREQKNQIWIFAPIKDEIGEKEVWIYDYGLDSWFIRKIPYEITGAATVLGEIYTLSDYDGGKIFVENKGNTFASKPIKFSFSSPFFNFSKPTSLKIIEDFEVLFDGASDNNFEFYISKDYSNAQDTLPETIKVEDGEALIWSDDTVDTISVWADGNTDFVWAKPYQECLKLDIFESLRSVQLHFRGNTTANDLTIIGFEFKEVVYEE